MLLYIWLSPTHKGSWAGGPWMLGRPSVRIPDYRTIPSQACLNDAFLYLWLAFLIPAMLHNVYFHLRPVESVTNRAVQ